ncbi:hypothetical protein [Williamsia sp. 1135]|uniref:hypothetical protein n=1 Tax=Williamsia sp. 1135 TaxID=1889262 RepID=UPI000A11FF80|nr:hypothetical protein [Williamsia sp. 1135]ORM35480.1 hypothetical protein BFL43_09165 [Williamsia sp. 1135]
MICWSITAHTNTFADNGILDAGVETTYNDAHHAAGDAALAALDHIAGQEPDAIVFLCISIDDNPLLLAAAGHDEHGTVDHASLTAAAAHVRDTGQAYAPAPTPW